ncbi:MAG: hypothetical protein M3Q65_20570 [Chloroflexota bacterium]|nr:hypothetical protein [Chloroflexota bacterium]
MGTGARRAIDRGNIFRNTVIAGYLVNTYVVFALIPTLRTGRRRALAGAVMGELAGFIVDLLAILGLRALRRVATAGDGRHGAGGAGPDRVQLSAASTTPPGDGIAG